MADSKRKAIQHIFIIGAKSIGQYGGFETFVDRLISVHEGEKGIKYHIACKANGEGYMNESRLSGVTVTKRDSRGRVQEFEYKNAHAFKIDCPNIGYATAVYYDRASLLYSIRFCEEKGIRNPIFYILTCRIGLFIDGLSARIKRLGGRFYLNPDGHEWKRAKWSRPVRTYWKWSEKKMVRKADLIICDSLHIKDYIRDEYSHPHTTYISYGADMEESGDGKGLESYESWLKNKGLEEGQYYLVVGRFVPENNFGIIIREFMKSDTDRKLVIIADINRRLKEQFERTLHFSRDHRIIFAGTEYDRELLKKIRENAYGYIHGHEVGGTNPSLLESMSATSLNLVLDVSFNREVGQDSVLYWSKNKGSLASLISEADSMDNVRRSAYGDRAKEYIKNRYSWKLVGDEYLKLWKA